MASRYDFFRKVIAPIAVVGALVLLVHETCRSQERAEVKFALELGDRAAAIRHVRVDLWADDASIGYLERSFGEGGVTAPIRWQQPLPDAPVEATIALTLAGGEVVSVRRRVPAADEVVLDVSR